MKKLDKKQLEKKTESIETIEERGYSKTVNLLIMIFTFLPFIYILFFISVFHSMHDSHMRSILMLLHFAYTIMMFCLMGFYISYIFKSPRIDKDKKILWVVVIFIGNIIAMPIFWYLYFLKNFEKKE